MKIIKLLMLMVIVSVTVACKKDEADKIDTKKDGREAILGSYNIENKYEIHGDETKTKNYVITIDKPTRDNYGDNLVVIKNLFVEQNALNVYAKLSPNGDVLDLFYDSELEDDYWRGVDSFQGIIEGNKILIKYEHNYGEKGTATATKR